MTESQLKTRETINKMASMCKTVEIDGKFTDEQIANIVIMLNCHYHLYYTMGIIFVLDITTDECIVKFEEYKDFVVWYDNLLKGSLK